MSGLFTSPTVCLEKQEQQQWRWCWGQLFQSPRILQVLGCIISGALLGTQRLTHDVFHILALLGHLGHIQCPNQKIP